MRPSRFLSVVFGAIFLTPVALWAQDLPESSKKASLQNDIQPPTNESETKASPEDDMIAPPVAPGASETPIPPHSDETRPGPPEESRIRPKTGWFHEGMIGIYGSDYHAGPGGHYALLYRPHILYAFGVHAGLANTYYENPDTRWTASLLYAHAAAEGRVYMVQDNLSLWISGNLGFGFLTEIDNETDNLMSDFGVLWGLGIGFEVSGKNFAFGMAYRYYRQVPGGETDDERSNYYGRGGINIHIAYHY